MLQYTSKTASRIYVALSKMRSSWFLLGLVSVLLGKAKGIDYVIKVRTGTSLGAGTDANVFIKIIGINGITAEHKLVGSGDPFERGSLDTFAISDNVQIGHLAAVKIRRDENGWFAKWQLENIAVQNTASGKWSMFPYDSWTSPNTWINIPVRCDADSRKNPQTGACEGPLCGTKVSAGGSHILGGSRVLPASWPWLGIVEFNDGSRICSGALILARWVMTTAWCVYMKKPTQMRVRFGANNAKERLSSEQTIDVESSFLNPDYHRPILMSHDLALLKLSRSVAISNSVRPACLPLDEIPLPVNHPTKRCWFEIWDRDTYDLKEVSIPLKTLSTCIKNRRPLQQVHESMICGKLQRNETGSCTSDAGAPLTCEAQGKWYLEGLSSTGTDCYVDGPKSRLFSNIRYMKQWVKKIINSNPDI